MNLDELRADIRQNMDALGYSSVRLAFQLAGVHRDRLYLKWGYKRFDAYVMAESRGNVSKSYGWKLVSVGKVFAPDRDVILQSYESNKISVNTLLELAGNIERGEVRRMDVVDALTKGTALPTPADTIATTKFQSVKPIPKELASIRDMAFNVARFHLDKAEPTELEMWEWILLNALDEAKEQEHTTSDGRKLVFSPMDITEGKIRCQECGNWNKGSLDPHHVIPRSKAGGKEGPIVLLCRDCHIDVQSRWEEWATEKGFIEAGVV